MQDTGCFLLWMKLCNMFQSTGSHALGHGAAQTGIHAATESGSLPQQASAPIRRCLGDSAVKACNPSCAPPFALLCGCGVTYIRVAACQCVQIILLQPPPRGGLHRSIMAAAPQSGSAAPATTAAPELPGCHMLQLLDEALLHRVLLALSPRQVHSTSPCSHVQRGTGYTCSCMNCHTSWLCMPWSSAGACHAICAGCVIRTHLQALSCCLLPRRPVEVLH